MTISEIKQEEFEAFKKHYEKLQEKFSDEESDYMRNLKTIQSLKYYAKENFDKSDFIGTGAFKVVYQFDDHTVLKIAKPEEFKDMLRVYRSKYSEIVPEIIDVGNYWLRSERVLTDLDNPNVFKEIFYNEYEIAKKYFDKRDNKTYEFIVRSLIDAAPEIKSFTDNASENYVPLGRRLVNYKWNKKYMKQIMGSDNTLDYINEHIVPEILQDLEEHASPFFKKIVQASKDLGFDLWDVRPANVGITFDSKKPVIIDI